MNEQFLNQFLNVLNRKGHKDAHQFTSVEFKNFCYISPIHSNDQNIQNLLDAEKGGFLYSNNPEFLDGFIAYIQNNLIRDENISSDLLGGNIRFMVYKADNQVLKFIYSFSSHLILKIV